MRPRSLRVRLTLVVATLFAAALTCAGLIARNQLSEALEADATATAESLLRDFFEPPAPGASASAVDTSNVTQFVYLDADGNEVSGQQLEQLIENAIRGDLGDPLASITIDVPPALELIPLSDDALLAEIGVLQPIQSTGPSEVVDTDDAAILVLQPASVGEVPITVGVATPRKPIADTVRTVTLAGLLMLPVLTAVVAAATWLTAARALRPVEAIRAQVARTDPLRLDERVPQPHTGDEIDRLATTMNDLLDRLQDANERQRQFISDASHELRSPITATLATIDTTSADSIADTWPTTADTIRSEQQRLAHLVDDLLLLAQLDESTGPPLTEQVDLDELAIDHAARPHPCPVHVYIEQPHRITGNARLLSRCLGNLIDNAARHAHSRVDVTIATTQRGEAVVRIDDDGPGVPFDQRTNIFNRFARLDEARTRDNGGAGLGLAIAAQVAERHNATLEVTDSPSGGARFELTFEAPDV